jgi:hypothetical protein
MQRKLIVSGVYLANTRVPATEAIKITGQQRDQLQHELRVVFDVRPAEGASAGLAQQAFCCSAWCYSSHSGSAGAGFSG